MRPHERGYILKIDIFERLPFILYIILALQDGLVGVYLSDIGLVEAVLNGLDEFVTVDVAFQHVR